MIAIIINTLSLLVISTAMLTRANDLGWRRGWVWTVRRLGFIMAGFAPWAIAYVDIKSGGVTLNIFEILFRAGVAAVFMTTPYHPPFWKYVFKDDSTSPIWSGDRRGMPKRRSDDRKEAT